MTSHVMCMPSDAAYQAFWRSSFRTFVCCVCIVMRCRYLLSTCSWRGVSVDAIKGTHTLAIRKCHTHIDMLRRNYITALVYGAETWASKKALENKLEVAEMRMLRWMGGVTKLDHIRNERIVRTSKVGEITKQVKEKRLKWYGHVMTREEHYVG